MVDFLNETPDVRGEGTGISIKPETSAGLSLARGMPALTPAGAAVFEHARRVIAAIVRARSVPKADLDELADVMGIDVQRVPIRKDLCGWMLPLGDRRWRVVVNASHPETRQRFTLAHMLGHYHYHRPLMSREERVGTNDGLNYRQVADAPFHNPAITARDESQANAFAASIVMPDEILGSMVDRGMDARAIAKALCVSEGAAKLGIEHLAIRTAVNAINPANGDTRHTQMNRRVDEVVNGAARSQRSKNDTHHVLGVRHSQNPSEEMLQTPDVYVRAERQAAALELSDGKSVERQTQSSNGIMAQAASLLAKAANDPQLAGLLAQSLEMALDTRRLTARFPSSTLDAAQTLQAALEKRSLDR